MPRSLLSRLFGCAPPYPTCKARETVGGGSGMTGADDLENRWRARGTSEVMTTTAAGFPRALMDAWECRGSAFTTEERVAHRIDGLLPPAVETLDVCAPSPTLVCISRTHSLTRSSARHPVLPHWLPPVSNPGWGLVVQC